MCNNCNCFSEIREFIKGKESSDLIEILHKTQDIYGYIPKEVIYIIAKGIDIPASEIYGVVTFYSRFSLVPKGKYAISVCMGTACYVKGAENLLDEFSNLLGIKVGETTDDLLFSLIETRCVGDCANAPIVTVNDKVYTHVSKTEIRDILAEAKEV
ncbi:MULTISPECIES: NAD(P)H-dependent oxidoreductase subunit E [unclassified Parvimonas]|uniref:NADH-quinone oxidoreductase subunit NuoE family protein n=1 Tax=unclassified Parvimonas TaxID=1151464 RepID=UPI002B47EFFE|nr:MULTISPECIES: NAD(P)H-dependent oxidoreductase subunit E [unclassified Parvimonas]MEB3024907.1 NAD(P)H-dependent oxidoreductase subunit E [Parvimonas sp. M13]MEB3088948.1 NAD(P)H-dependent oxidoreductase subunit E [Parvimonas sp. M20]